VSVRGTAIQLPAIAGQCLALHLPTIGIQEGIVHEAGAREAQAGGMTVTMDHGVLKDQARRLTT
jgi:predicted CoA-binding protein